jgi:hypothetical protein
MLLGMLLVLIALNLYTGAKKGDWSGLTVPLALSPIAIVNLGTVQKIRKELASRNGEKSNSQ